MRVLSLASDPPVLGVPDSVDWHGIAAVSQIFRPPGAEIGLEDLECVAAPAPGDGLVTLFAGILRIGHEHVWVPAGAHLDAKAGQDRPVARWSGYWTTHLALETGHVRWELPHVRRETDVTGASRAVTTRPGEILVVQDDVVVQRVDVPAGAYVLVEDGETCSPGTGLALSDPPVYRAEARPRPDTATLVRQWAETAEDPWLPGARLGDLLKLLGDDLGAVIEHAPAKDIDPLVQIARRGPKVEDRLYLNSGLVGPEPPWACSLAEQRCRFRFLRGLRSAATLVR